MAQIERQRSLEYIKDPNSWVMLVCPIKRRARDHGFPETAYMIGDGPNIYHGNIHTRSQADRKEEFKDFEAIIDAGWVVD